MKKLLVAALAVSMVVSLTACGKKAAPAEAAPAAEESAKEAEEETQEEETREEESSGQGSTTIALTEDGEEQEVSDIQYLSPEDAEELLGTVADDFLNWAGLQYFDEPQKADHLTTEMAIDIAADVALTRQGEEFEWSDEHSGLEIPTEVLERTEMDLFAKTFDLSGYDSAKAMSSMVEISNDGKVYRRVGDWGLVIPVFDVDSVSERPDGSCDVRLRYYSLDCMSDTRNYAMGCFMNFVVAGNEDSEYGARIIDMSVDDELPFTVSAFIAEDEEMLPMYDVVLGEKTDSPYEPCYAMMASGDIEKIELCSLSMDYAEAEGLFGGETAVLDTKGPIPARTYFVVYPGDVGETLPLVGVRITEKDGTVRHYYLAISGEDGSAIVKEFDTF